MESGGDAGHDYDVSACASACKNAHQNARMLACIYTIFWSAKDHISANLGQFREVKVSQSSHNFRLLEDSWMFGLNPYNFLPKFGRHDKYHPCGTQ